MSSAFVSLPACDVRQLRAELLVLVSAFDERLTEIERGDRRARGLRHAVGVRETRQLVFVLEIARRVASLLPASAEAVS